MQVLEKCVGCGVSLQQTQTPVHKYMDSSPSCYHAFTTILAAEYSNLKLMQTHRMSVDTYAVQHPGDPTDRRCVQSVGLHLARLYLQLENPTPPLETNQIMLDFSSQKVSLIFLPAPSSFQITAGDIVPFVETDAHPNNVIEWATKTWEDWSEHHNYIQDWVKQHST